MSHWKSDFEVRYYLEFKHSNGRVEKLYDSQIIHAEDEKTACELLMNDKENSQFLKIYYVKRIWKY